MNKDLKNHLFHITETYKTNFSDKFCDIKAITPAGSNRKYFRITAEKNTVIAVYSENIAENETFLYYTSVFRELNLNVPKIYYVNESKTIYFVEDFGDELLLNIVEQRCDKEKFSDDLMDLYKKSISALAKMQILSGEEIDFSKSFSGEEFGKQAILMDLSYFKYYFLNVSGITYSENKLQNDFEKFANYLCRYENKYFMFRDFQARNIIIKNNEAYFIDYQGGRKGFLQYDLASLLYQAKAKIPNNVKEILLQHYIDEVRKYIDINKSEFIEEYYYLVYLRILQTLGAYGFRGLIEKRTHFVESIPYALANLKDLCQKNPVLEEYCELWKVLSALVNLTKYNRIEYTRLTVTVTSFSFKKGYPEDKTQNGGGFVFDCRGISNPGRFEKFKTQTGKDAEVIAYFKENSNIDEFVENAIHIVKPSIEDYLNRNFNSLCVSFGCTGGQHRSVYCAEKFAKDLLQNFKNIDIFVNHREQ